MKLANLLASGVKWASFSKFFYIVLQYITILILASLLNPEDFGLMGTALIFIGFFNIIKDFGINSGLIQLQEKSQKLYSSVFWFNILIGIMLFVLMFISAEFLSDYFNEPRLKIIFQVLALSFIFNGISILPQTLFEKELIFDSVAKVEVLASIIGSLTGVILAYNDFGVWALVMQYLAYSFSLMFFYWIFSSFRPNFYFDFKEIKKILSFGLNFSGFNILNYFVRNADRFLIGKFLGMEQLGFYTLAYRIMLFPIQNLTAVIAKVSYPVISKIKNSDEEVRNVYKMVVKAIAFIAFPVMIGLFALNDIFVSVFFDVRWNKIIDLLYILIPVGILQSVYTMTGILFQAKNKTDVWFKWGLFAAIVTVSGFLIGLQWGIIGIAISYLITNLILFYPISYLAFNFIGMKVFEFHKNLVRIFTISLIMGFIVYFLKILLESYLSNMALFVSLVSCGVILYLSFSYYFNSEFVHVLLKYIRSKAS